MSKGFGSKQASKKKKTSKGRARSDQRRSLNQYGFSTKNQEYRRQEYVECSDCHHVVYTTIREHWEKCAKCGSENVDLKTDFYEDIDHVAKIVEWIESNNLTMCIETEEDEDIDFYQYDPGWGWSAETKDGMGVGF